MNVLDFGKTKDGVQTHLYTIKNEDLECRFWIDPCQPVCAGQTRKACRRGPGF